LDEIVELLKSGQPTFGRLYSPLHRLRGIEPVASRREEVAALLDPLLTTGDFSVRHAAYDAVEVWGTQRNVPTLLAILDGSDRSERWPAMEALGKIGGSPEAAARLAKLMLDSGESLQAKRALEDMGAVAEDPVWQLVGNSDNLIHSYACQVLGKVGTSKSLERLKSRPKEAQTVRQVSVDLAVQDMQGRLRGQLQN